MRILMISDVYFPRINGVSTSIQTFRQYMIAAGHEVVLIAPSYKQPIVDDPGIIRIPSSRVPFDPEDRLMHGKYIRSLTKSLCLQRFDIIHIHTPFVAHRLGLHLAHAIGIPCIETYHTFFEEYLYNYIPLVPKSWLKSLARKISVQQCNQVGHVIVPSTAMRQVLVDYGVTNDTSIIPTGMAPRTWQRGDGAAFRQKYNIPADRPVLLNVSRVAHEKNIDFLIRMLTHVWQDIPDVLLVIAGDGPAKSYLQRLASSLGLENNVLFIGYLDREIELNDCFCCSDIFVFASRTETQGLVLLEAMAQAAPVISTAHMGTRDLLLDNPGALIADDDEAKFAVMVTRLLTKELQRKRMSEQAVQFSKQWTADKMGARMLQLYAQICGAKKRPVSQEKTKKIDMRQCS